LDEAANYNLFHNGQNVIKLAACVWSKNAQTLKFAKILRVSATLFQVFVILSHQHRVSLHIRPSNCVFELQCVL